MTRRFDEDFNADFHRHSASGAHRVMMLDCRELGSFGEALRQARAKLVLEITGVTHLPDVRYQVGTYDAYDPAAAPETGVPALLCPNTTTLVNVVLNRRQTDKLLQVRSASSLDGAA